MCFIFAVSVGNCQMNAIRREVAVAAHCWVCSGSKKERINQFKRWVGRGLSS